MRRLGPDDWRKLIPQYETGGQSQKEFCNAHDVSIHTFQFWLYKLRKTENSYSDSAGHFLPVTVVGSPAPKARGRDGEPLIEVARHGVTLRFPVGTDTRYVAELVAALG